MNKEKLVDVIEQVLTPVDELLEKELRKHLDQMICREVSELFSNARNFVDDDIPNKNPGKLAYEIVKPVLDDCIDRLMSRRS